MDSDQKKAVQNYQKLHRFFQKTLTLFNLDYFNPSKDFGVRNLFFMFIILLSFYYNVLNMVNSYNEEIPVIRIIWTLNLAWFIVHFMAFAKAFTFVYNKEEFFFLLDKIGELYSKIYSKIVLPIQQKNLKETFKLTIMASVAIFVIFWFTELMALALLFTLPGIRFPMLYEIPLSQQSPTLYYIFNMILQFFIYFTILTIVLLSDLFIIFFGLHLRCEMKTICEICEKCLDDYNIVKNEKKLLKEVYEKHAQVLKMLETLDDIYRHLSFYQIFTSFTAICLIFYIILDQEEFDVTVYMLAIMSTLELFVLCLFGETLVASTEQLGVSIYLTKWYEMTVSEQKNLLFIMQIAQRPHGIKAAGLIDVNFFTFVETMKAVVSYCAILYALTTEKS